MKTFFIFICSICLNTYAARPIKEARDLKTSLNEIKQNQVIELLREFLQASKPARLMGSPGHAGAVNFLTEKIQSLDKEKTGTFSLMTFNPDIKKAKDFYEQDFKLKVEGKFPLTSPEYKNWKAFTKSMQTTMDKFSKIEGKNLIWEKKGEVEPNKVIIIGANYDTVNIDAKTNQIDLKGKMPGADKNGTGVVTLLKLIEILSQHKLKKTVRIIFFDYQSFGFLGSYDYALRVGPQSKEQIEAFIAIEMIGHDSKLFDTEKRMGNMKLYFSTTTSKTYMAELDLAQYFTRQGKVNFPDVSFEPTGNGFEFSDNISFQAVGIPSLVFSQNWETDFNNKRYHTSEDFVETINQRTFHKSLLYIASGVISWSLDLK